MEAATLGLMEADPVAKDDLISNGGSARDLTACLDLLPLSIEFLRALDGLFFAAKDTFARYVLFLVSKYATAS